MILHSAVPVPTGPVLVIAHSLDDYLPSPFPQSAPCAARPHPAAPPPGPPGCAPPSPLISASPPTVATYTRPCFDSFQFIPRKATQSNERKATNAKQCNATQRNTKQRKATQRNEKQRKSTQSKITQCSATPRHATKTTPRQATSINNPCRAHHCTIE